MATKTRKPLQALGLADNFLFGRDYPPRDCYYKERAP